MPKTVADLVSQAKSNVENLTPDQVAEELLAGAVVVDLREPAELANDGMIEGAAHAPRGLLEFWADPSRARTTERSSIPPAAPSCTARLAAAQPSPQQRYETSATPTSPTSTAASRAGSKPAAPSSSRAMPDPIPTGTTRPEPQGRTNMSQHEHGRSRRCRRRQSPSA